MLPGIDTVTSQSSPEQVNHMHQSRSFLALLAQKHTTAKPEVAKSRRIVPKQSKIASTDIAPLSSVVKLIYV